MQIGLRAYIYSIIIIVVLLFGIGAITWQKRPYDCYPASSDMYQWGKRTEVFNLGSLHFYVTPLIKNCPKEYQYDPAKIIKCGAYCPDAPENTNL